MVTKEAIVRMNMGTRMDLGIHLRHDEMVNSEQVSTKAKAKVMPMALTTLTETASTGHNPSIRMKTGFSFKIPRLKIEANDFIASLLQDHFP